MRVGALPGPHALQRKHPCTEHGTAWPQLPGAGSPGAPRRCTLAQPCSLAQPQAQRGPGRRCKRNAALADAALPAGGRPLASQVEMRSLDPAAPRRRHCQQGQGSRRWPCNSRWT